MRSENRSTDREVHDASSEKMRGSTRWPTIRQRRVVVSHSRWVPFTTVHNSSLRGGSVSGTFNDKRSGTRCGTVIDVDKPMNIVSDKPICLMPHPSPHSIWWREKSNKSTVDLATDWDDIDSSKQHNKVDCCSCSYHQVNVPKDTWYVARLQCLFDCFNIMFLL